AGAPAVPDEVELPPDPGRAALEGELSLPLVLALVDEVTSTAGPNGSSVHMTVGCGPWEGQPDA
ncbi:MAG: ATP-binding protein, partial [Acidimicrobiales bacterium]